MLNTDPIQRITIKDMLSHPWLRVIDRQQQNDSVRSRRPSFDEILRSCHELFPETSINELKQNILTGFGYQTATYWLLKKNPDAIKVFNSIYAFIKFSNIFFSKVLKGFSTLLTNSSRR